MHRCIGAVVHASYAFHPSYSKLTITTHARSSGLPRNGAWGPTPDLIPVPWSGALMAVVATGGFEPMAEGTVIVYGEPDLPTEPPVTP